MELMNKFYDWLLWITGFQEDEEDDDTFSDMLVRQKQRMGWVWWFFPITTIVFTFCMLILEFWLMFHIIWLKLRGRRDDWQPIKRGK